jgi:nucleotide-binding universal stress UspA family protein
MKWLVGLDLARSVEGATHFCRWAHEATGDQALGVHVMDLPFDALPEWSEVMGVRLREMLAKQLGHAGAGFMEVEVVRDPDAVGSLMKVRERSEADATVVGRKAKVDGHGLIRLGAVARRAVRRADSPLIIVPPDVDMEVLTGPVLLATDATERTSGEAVRFAAKVAAAWKRPWQACMVAEHVDEYAATYFSNPERLAAAQEQMRQAGQRVLDAWSRNAARTPDDVVLLQGSRVQTLLDRAQELKSPLIVVGSRRLSSKDRIFTSSVGAALAAYAHGPVAIVPPAPPE